MEHANSPKTMTIPSPLNEIMGQKEETKVPFVNGRSGSPILNLTVASVQTVTIPSQPKK
jgi:hypothetical protein